MDRALQDLLHYLLNEDPCIELETARGDLIRFCKDNSEVRIELAHPVFYVTIEAGSPYNAAMIQVVRKFPKDTDLAKLAQTILKMERDIAYAVEQLKENLPEGVK